MKHFRNCTKNSVGKGKCTSYYWNIITLVLHFSDKFFSKKSNHICNNFMHAGNDFVIGASAFETGKKVYIKQSYDISKFETYNLCISFFG